MAKQLFGGLTVGFSIVLSNACGNGGPPAFRVDEPGGGDEVSFVLGGVDDDPFSAEGVSEVMASDTRFARVGVRFTMADATALQVRVGTGADAWGEWNGLVLVFSEEDAHAGHFDVPGSNKASHVQLRVAPGALPPSVVVVELIADRVDVPEQPADAPTVSAATPDSTSLGLGVTIQSRSSWGARTPRCKSFTGVTRATVHHTAGANDDSTPITVQLRQIQAFHMFSRGWCDVGYNFLVSRDGRVWEGRGMGVLGAHTDGDNSGNMGVSLIGTYQSVAPPAAQQTGLVEVLRLLHDQRGIPLVRTGANGVKGHRQRGNTSTSCPGDRLYGLLDGLVAQARDGGASEPAPPAPTGDSAADVDNALGLTHFHNRGSTDVNGDGVADVCARNNTTIRCRLTRADGVDNWQTIVDGPDLSDASGWVNAPRYETLRMGDIDGDGDADLCGRSADGLSCWPSNGTSFGARWHLSVMTTEQGWAEPWHYATIAMADVNGDGLSDVCGRRDAGYRCWLSTGSGFGDEIVGPAYGDDNGWTHPEHFGTIRLGDVNGDGKADVCARATEMMRCWLSDGTGFPQRIDGPAWSNADGWNRADRWSTITLVDINADDKADLCGRGGTGIRCRLSTGTGFDTRVSGPAWSDNGGWKEPENYLTIRYGDVTGDGLLDVCARRDSGMACYRYQPSSQTFELAFATDVFSDAAGWNVASKYRTIRLVDINADGKADVCGRGSVGLRCFLSTGSALSEERRATMYADDNGWAQEVYYGTLRMSD